VRLHATEWDAVEIALRAYVARIGDLFASIDAVDEMPMAVAGTIIVALRLATKSVMSLHTAIAAARDRRERADHWKRHRNGRAVEPARILVRHHAVELLPSFLQDFAAELKAVGREDASTTFERLAKVVRRALGIVA
jgi:hypothetical protein